MVMITSTRERDLGRRTVGGAVSFDDIALADEVEASARGGATSRTPSGADKWSGAAGSFGDSPYAGSYSGTYPAVSPSAAVATPARSSATPSRSELIAVYWQAHQGTPSTIIQGMRDFGVSVAEFAAATGQSADTLGRYLQAGGAENGFGGWFAPVAAAAAASVASTTVAVAATPSRSAIIAEYWQAYRGTPSTIIQGMRSYGVSVAEFAVATGQSVDALGRYLKAGGAEDGFGGWFAPVVAATTATTVTSTRSAEHNALIRVFWEANKASVKTISDAMSEFKVSVAELAFATGQTVEQVEGYLLRGAVAAATATTTGASTTEQGSSTRATDLSSGSDSIGDVTAHAQGSTTSTSTTGAQGLTEVAKTATAQTSQLTPDQLTRVANYWSEHQADPYRIMQSMVENGVSAIDLAVATGQSVQDVADYLSRNGAPAGFADSGCVDRRQVDAAFLSAVNAAQSAGVGVGWSVLEYIAQDDLGRDFTASKSSFDHRVFIAWYASQDTTEAQTFSRLHGADFSKSGASYSPGYWQTHGESDFQQWVATNQISWGHTAQQAGERIHAYLGYAKADAQEAAAMDLMLSEPVSEDLLAHFGGTASLPETEQGERMRARFGSARATELYRYGLASNGVRELYVQALDAAKSQSPQDNTAEQPWWRITLTTQSWDFGEVRRTAEFDLQTFTTWYASQDTLASRLFKQLNGSQITTVSSSQSQGDNDPLTITESYLGDGAFLMSGGQLVGTDYPTWSATTLTATGGNRLMQINLGNPPEMFDPSLVLFDPMVGFVTPFENVVPEVDRVGQLIPMVIGMVVAWYAAPAMAASVGAAGNAVVIAGASAVVSTTVTSLLTTGRIDLEDVLTSALTAVLTAGLSEALHLNTMGMGVDSLGNKIVINWADKITAIGAKAVLGGVLSKLSGGDFEVGAGQALAGMLAGAVVDAMNVQIATNADLSATERSTMRLFAKAAGAAIRITASPGDPRFAMASEFMNELLLSIDTKQTQGTGPWSDANYENGFDLEGDKAVVTIPADPFVNAGQDYNDGATSYRESLAAYLNLSEGDIVNAGWKDYLPDGRSIDFFKGFVQGSGFSLLNMGEAVAEIAKNPVQFLDGVKALINSPEARAQMGEAIVTQVKVDLQMLEDAYNSGDWVGTGQQVGKLTADLAGVAGGVEAIGRLGVTGAKAGGRLLLNAAEDLALTRSLYQMGGMLGSDGKPLMDFGMLSKAQKQVIGELMGPDVVKGIVPDAERLGRIQSAGTNGIDDLYKVTRPDLDYLIVEYKFGKSTLGTSADGLQMSDGWVLGSERILKSVGDPAEALKITDAVALGRVEKWIVHTDPAGGTSVWIVDATGKIIKADSTITSKILGGTK